MSGEPIYRRSLKSWLRRALIPVFVLGTTLVASSLALDVMPPVPIESTWMLSESTEASSLPIEEGREMEFDIFALLSLLVGAIGGLGTYLYRMQRTLRDEISNIEERLREDLKEISQKAFQAEQRVIIAELTMAREYVSRQALNEMRDHLLREMKTGFDHLSEKIDLSRA